jgi:hypothetical protein
VVGEVHEKGQMEHKNSYVLITIKGIQGKALTVGISVTFE